MRGDRRGPGDGSDAQGRRVIAMWQTDVRERQAEGRQKGKWKEAQGKRERTRGNQTQVEGTPKVTFASVFAFMHTIRSVGRQCA